MAEIFIEDRFLVELRRIVNRVVPSARVLLYGSRVDGTAHSGGDLDLAIVGVMQLFQD